MDRRSLARALLRTPARMLTTLFTLAVLVFVLPLVLVLSGLRLVALLVLLGGVAVSASLAVALLPARHRWD